MPIFWIKTNVKTPPPAELHGKMVDLMVDMFQKDKKYMQTTIDIGQDMNFGGTNAPCAFVQIGSIFCIDKKLNQEHSRKISELLKKYFNIPADRYYVSFSLLDPDFVGHQGTTFAGMVSKK